MCYKKCSYLPSGQETQAHNNGYTIRLNASAFFPCADGGTLIWLCVDNRSPCKGIYVFSPTNGLWRTKSCRATVTAELCVWFAHEIGCVLMLRYGHMKMPSRFRCSLVSCRNSAWRCHEVLGHIRQNSLSRSMKDHQYNSNEGKLKKVHTPMDFFTWII